MIQIWSLCLRTLKERSCFFVVRVGLFGKQWICGAFSTDQKSRVRLHRGLQDMIIWKRIDIELFNQRGGRCLRLGDLLFCTVSVIERRYEIRPVHYLDQFESGMSMLHKMIFADDYILSQRPFIISLPNHLGD
jgi:hypothetical protein